MKRTLAVFLCAAGAALALAIIKALALSGLDTLPPVRVLVFAASMFGLLAALVDWALLRHVIGTASKPEHVGIPERRHHAVATIAPQVPHPDSVIARARRRPIVFREICPSPATALSFYGGAPVGPATLAWPRKKHGDVPLSFVMQWDCTELAAQDVTGLLPQDGGPARVREGGIRPEPWQGASLGLRDHELMMATGLEDLAAVQLRPWPRTAEERQIEEQTKMLPGHLLVLRFFASVQRHTAESGLPVSAKLQVGVERPLGGEDALTQLEPRLSMELPCSVRPISAAVEQRVKQRHEVHVAQWHENTDKLLRNLRAKFESDGYAPRFMIPDELVETKERLRSLERRLLHRHFLYRLRRRGFDKLTKEIRAVREQTAPAPIDPTPYR